MNAVNRRMSALKAVTDRPAAAVSTAVSADELAAAIVATAPCADCRSAKRKLTEAARIIEQLQFRIERMSRAVQRDGSFYQLGSGVDGASAKGRR